LGGQKGRKVDDCRLSMSSDSVHTLVTQLVARAIQGRLTRAHTGSVP